MSEWILCDADQILDLGEKPEDVEEKLLGLLLGHKLSSPNAIVDIGSPRRAALAVGLAGNNGYVEFGSMDGDPPYYRALNPSSPSEKPPDIVFLYKGERTPLPAKNCFPVDDIVRIVKHFIATETIPAWIAVEEV